MVTLRDLVISSGLRQTWIAEKMGINHTLLNHWLAKRRQLPVRYLIPLAEVLRLDPRDVAEAAYDSVDDTVNVE